MLPFRSENTKTILTHRFLLSVLVIMAETVVTLQPKYGANEVDCDSELVVKEVWCQIVKCCT